MINLSTPLGLVVAALGRAQVHSWRDGLLLASNYRFPFPPTPAFTLGNVILVRAQRDDLIAFDVQYPDLMEHEDKHATQFAWCLGPIMLPLYVGACGWSWIRCGDWWSRNVFEQHAGLLEGGYLPQPTRTERRRLARGTG